MADDRSTTSPPVNGSPPPDADFSSSESQGEAAALAHPPGSLQPAHLVAGICILGLVLTALATWAVARADKNTEQRLLQTQTRQGAGGLWTAKKNRHHPQAGPQRPARGTEAAGRPTPQHDRSLNGAHCHLFPA